MSVFTEFETDAADSYVLYPTDRFTRFGADLPDLGDDEAVVYDGDGMPLSVGMMVKVGVFSGWSEIIEIRPEFREVVLMTPNGSEYPIEAAMVASV